MNTGEVLLLAALVYSIVNAVIQFLTEGKESTPWYLLRFVLGTVRYYLVICVLYGTRERFLPQGNAKPLLFAFYVFLFVYPLVRLLVNRSTVLEFVTESFVALCCLPCFLEDYLGVNLFAFFPKASLIGSSYLGGTWAVGIVDAILLLNVVFMLYYENIYGAYRNGAYYSEMAVRFLTVLQIVLLILSIGLARTYALGKVGALCLFFFYVYILPKCCYNIAALQDPATFVLNIVAFIVLFLFAWKDLTGFSLFLAFFEWMEALLKEDSAFGRFLRWIIDNPDKATTFLSILAGGSGGISLWTVITGIIDLFRKEEEPEPEPELALLEDAYRRYRKARGRRRGRRGRRRGSNRHVRITKRELVD